ncbi:MAG: hypothetical protein RLZZ608_90 [Actinomycetota bacterium]|jgi:hypothetical protein
MRSRLLAVSLLATLCLTGCAGPAPEAATSPTATPSTTPTPTPTPEDPVPADLVVRGLGVELYDSEGELVGSFIWSDETTTALSVLELAFGPAPAPGFQAGDGTHIADFDTYDFGGIVYGTAAGLTKPRTEYFLPSWVQVSTGSPINGVSISTIEGLHVGSPLADVLALSPDPALTDPRPLGTSYLIDPVDPILAADPEQSTDMVSLVVDEAGAVVLIDAPRRSRTFF